MAKVQAPFNNAQIRAIVKWQSLDHVHPFTCPYHSGIPLLVNTAGFHCQVTGCDYRQDWAHDFMADESQHPKPPL